MDGKKHIFYGIDDSTSDSLDIKADQGIMKIATTSRHLKLTFFLVAHNCRAVLTTTFRANIDHLFVFKCTTLALIKAIYEEYFSLNPMFENLKDFIKFYDEYIIGVKHAGLYVNCLKHTHNNFNPYVKDMDFMTRKYKIPIPKKIKKSQNGSTGKQKLSNIFEKKAIFPRKQ
jgi:hypothetical protein